MAGGDGDGTWSDHVTPVSQTGAPLHAVGVIHLTCDADRQ